MAANGSLFANLLRSWECGVIFPVPASAGDAGDAGGDAVKQSGDDQGSPGFEVFRGYVPVPMVVPGEKYGTKRPWFN
jgi:hypothetical protein